MNNHRFPRAFNENSLELKCLGFFGVSLFLVIILTFALVWIVAEKLIAMQNPRTGRMLVDEVILIKHWEGMETHSGFEDFLPLVGDLTAKLSQQQFEYRILKPGDANQTLTEFEKAAMQKFMGPIPPQFQKAAIAENLLPGNDESANPGSSEVLLEANPQPLQTDSNALDDATETDKSPDKIKERLPDPDYVGHLDGSDYKYYQAVRSQRSCFTAFCHRDISASVGAVGTSSVTPGLMTPGMAIQPVPEGTLMAVVQVSIPNKPTQRLISRSWNLLLGVGIFAIFLGIIAFYITIRSTIIRPLRHLRDVADAVTHGDISLRAELNTGDEFESLGQAFNRMLRHLVRTQDELRSVNTDLDSKVDQLANATLQLYEMNRIKSDFLSAMSHELRTPLNSILGFSEVLGGIDQLTPQQKRYVQNIQTSGKLLLSMINDILDLAKMESGRMEVHLLEFPIERIVGAQCDMARPLAEKKNIALIEEIPPNLPPVVQDQSRLQQILNNLLSNAIKFTPEGGSVRVTIRREEQQNQLIMIVSDTGVGIAEEDQQKIFEKFRQGSSTVTDSVMTREYSGTGLGLSIVKEICKLLQGEVTVESRLAVGSSFTVRVPWVLEKTPRLDSPLMSELEAFSKSTFERPMR